MRLAFRFEIAFALTCAVAMATALVPVNGQRGRGGAATTETAPAPSGPIKLVVIGCIKQVGQAGSPNAELTISDYRDGPDTTFRLDPKDSKVTPWVDSTVEITGTVAAGSESPAAGASASGTSGAKAMLKLNVEKVAVVSRGCKAQKK